ncbi:Potassium voltage-gated channel subfamily H member 1 [Gryllus bimaculatus]|nr:Potassium voltage-gated channel subfamily H member 1 [Gryllus bimaculatus]
MRPLAWDPASDFVFRWEIMRVTVAMLAVLLHPCAYSAFIDSLTTRVIGYYNEEGILITHPAYTIKHYLKTAFFVDVMSFFPFEFIPIGDILKISNVAFLRYCVRLLRCLQVYRFLVFMDYLDARMTYRFLTANIVKCIAVIITVMNVIANALLFRHCENWRGFLV